MIDKWRPAVQLDFFVFFFVCLGGFASLFYCVLFIILVYCCLSFVLFCFVSFFDMIDLFRNLNTYHDYESPLYIFPRLFRGVRA